MELFLFLGSLFAFLFIGIPISMVLVLCSIVLMWHSGMWDSMIIPSTMLDGANNYPLMAIPFFVFAGEIMAEGGLSKRVVQLAQLMIGRVRGGLGYAAIISSVIFAGLMGSSVGEAAALGGLLLPMIQARPCGRRHRLGRHPWPHHPAQHQLHPAGCDHQRPVHHQAVHDRPVPGHLHRPGPDGGLVLHRAHRWL